MARKARSVFVPGTNMTFPSASAAAKALGMKNASNIYSVLSGKRKTAGGYSFGYTSNRVVYVPETGNSYESVKAAARSVGANVAKAEQIVSAGVDKTVKGYHFQYQDASRLSAAAGTVSAPAKNKKRKANKKERLKQHRQKQQERQKREQQRDAIRQKSRSEAAAKQRKEERLRALEESYETYKDARKLLQGYMKRLNQQIDRYINISPAQIYYHQASPSVFGMQLYTGYQDGPYDITYFDEALSKFELSENATKDDAEKMADRMNLLYERLKLESEQKGRNFFDPLYAEQNRTMLSLEFFKTTGHESDMDKYAYMIWDILDVINRSREYPEMGSDLIFQAVSDAMQGDINYETLEIFINHLDGWMKKYSPDSDRDEDAQTELERILSELDGAYTGSQGYSVFDEDEWWF